MCGPTWATAVTSSRGSKSGLGWTVEIVKGPSKWGRYPVDVEPPPMPRFTVLPRRLVVEMV